MEEELPKEEIWNGRNLLSLTVGSHLKECFDNTSGRPTEKCQKVVQCDRALKIFC